MADNFCRPGLSVHRVYHLVQVGFQVYAVTSKQQPRRNVCPVSFGFRLTTDTLAFGEVLPATGRLWDFHPLDFSHTGRTQKNSTQFCFCIAACCLLGDCVIGRNWTVIQITHQRYGGLRHALWQILLQGKLL